MHTTSLVYWYQPPWFRWSLSKQIPLIFGLWQPLRGGKAAGTCKLTQKFTLHTGPCWWVFLPGACSANSYQMWLIMWKVYKIASWAWASFLLHFEDEARVYLQWVILLQNQIKILSKTVEERLHLFYFQKQRNKKRRKEEKKDSKMAVKQYNSNVTFTTSLLSAITQQALQSLWLNLLMTYCRLCTFMILFSAKYKVLLSIQLWKRGWTWAGEKRQISIINLQCINHFCYIFPQHSMSMLATVLQSKNAGE